MSEYDGVIVEMLSGTGNQNITSRVYVKKNDNLTDTINFGGGACGYYDGSNHTWGRTITKFTNDGITFSDAMVDKTINNSSTIPYKIYGVKSYLVESKTGHTNYRTTIGKTVNMVQSAKIDVSNTDSVTLNFTFHPNGSSLEIFYGLSNDEKEIYYYGNKHGQSALGFTNTTTDTSITLDTSGYKYIYVEQQYATTVTYIDVVYN